MRPASKTTPFGPDTAGPPANRRFEPRRFLHFGVVVLLFSLLFIRPLSNLFGLAWNSELHSHIVLIPFIFAYLVYLRRERLPDISARSVAWSMFAFLAGAVCLVLSFAFPPISLTLDASDHLALRVLAFVCFIAAGGCPTLGLAWMRALTFPFFFLLFLVPLPDTIVFWLETGSKLASADMANLLFNLSGTPILREGTIFQLPGIVLEVAQECSGIRSSLVLFITSLLVANLFLQTTWRRALLVGFVIPLGILRNGFRILVIGLLCVRYGPQMIESVIHRRGGPLFFALSLIPLFLLVWWLRRGEPAVDRGAASERRNYAGRRILPHDNSAVIPPL